jgi:2-succinyl-5-enolpyruvyl-6-hydroxy-3-cyclohexene-1-carboxylate synthase
MFIEQDAISHQKITKLFNKYPHSEQSYIHNLSKYIKNNSRVYLGNSLPIRTWDFAAVFNNKNLHIEASRGLNGIDGQVSTFLGFAESDVENWAILGDLTTLYDQAGPWALQYRPNLNINIVVVNNSGGMIFKGVLSGKSAHGCQNIHSLNFKNWAAMWDIEYELWNEASIIKKNENKLLNRKRIIEIKPNETQTAEFSNEYQEI